MVIWIFIILFLECAGGNCNINGVGENCNDSFCDCVTGYNGDGICNTCSDDYESDGNNPVTCTAPN